MRYPGRISPIILLVAGLVPAAPCLGQGAGSQDYPVSVTPRVVSRRSARRLPSIRVDVNLVLIPVTVTDLFGAPVLGLPRETFRLFEDGVEQQLAYFMSDDAPVSLGIVFDASRSMRGKITQARAAVGKLFTTAIPGDEYSLIEFNNAPRVLCDFTGDAAQIEKAALNITPKNWTALLDAVYLSIRQLQHARNERKALLILSDGRDNNSRYTVAEMKTLIREADVCIYSITLGGGLMKRNVRLLRQLARETGGLLCHVEKTSDLAEAVAEISLAIRSRYVLGYFPRNSNDGKYHRIEVRVNQRPGGPRLHASWRRGYYASAGW